MAKPLANSCHCLLHQQTECCKHDVVTLVGITAATVTRHCSTNMHSSSESVTKALATTKISNQRSTRQATDKCLEDLRPKTARDLSLTVRETLHKPASTLGQAL